GLGSHVGGPFVGYRAWRRLRSGVPELPGSRARRLARGLSRREPRSAGRGQERLRPAPVLSLPAIPLNPASKEHTMGKVYSAHSVSVDGYITGRGPAPGRGLGDGTMLFDWYFDGDTPSRVFDGFRLSEPRPMSFHSPARQDDAIAAARTTYDDPERLGGACPPPDAPLSLLTHRPSTEISERQTLVTTGIENATAAARKAAGDKDVGL